MKPILFVASMAIHCGIGITLGFSPIFMAMDWMDQIGVLRDGLLGVWSEHLLLVWQQLWIGHRAPFAWVLIGFVGLLPAVTGYWQAGRESGDRPPRGMSVCAHAGLAALAGCIALYVALSALLQLSGGVRVMELVNLWFAGVLVCIWAMFYCGLSILAGRLVHAVFRKSADARAA